MGIVYLVNYLVGTTTVGIVRAMIGQPKILLMDEPFRPFDAISRKQLQILTKELHKEFGMTTIFVTHDTDEALKLGGPYCCFAGWRDSSGGESRDDFKSARNRLCSRLVWR